MSLLALYFLGYPRVSLDQAVVEIPRRKVMALLVYLAVTAQRHSRDELAELLFGKRDREHARASLRQTLSLLRSAVGNDRLGADRLGVWLSRAEGLWIDVTEFRRLLKKGQASNITGDVVSAKNNLTEAADLFRGDFLSSFYLRDSAAFEDWQLMVQESLRCQQITTLQRLAEIHEVEGQLEQAVEYGRRGVALNPLEEAAHRQLMRLYASGGRRFEAVRQYDRCRSLLKRELGVEPEQETERLHEQIISWKHLPGADARPVHTRDDVTSLPAKPLLGTPLFLFVQLAASGEDKMKQQEVRFRDIAWLEGGKILSTAGGLQYAVFFKSDAAIRAAQCIRDRVCGINRGVRIVLFADERAQQQAPSAILVEQAEMLLKAAHPGQILLDETAVELAREVNLPEDTTLRFLGIHQLKDSGPAQPLHLMEHINLPQDISRLEIHNSRPNNLKIQPTPFIGREKELASVLSTLLSAKIQLLTLTGAAGTGKTRLALQAAAELYNSFEQGLFFVDLAVLREPTHLAGAVTSVLNVRETGRDGQSLLETLKDYLREKKVLLVLDNFEHLLPAAPQIAELLADCPKLKILATSREALHIQAERVFPVPPMQLPSRGQSPASMNHCEAVKLFSERAAAVQPTFELSENNAEVVAEICRRLDGLPLAIELAAIHIGILTPDILLTKLKSRLNLLKGGPRDLPARQQTLKGEIDWSYELLDAGQRRAFMQLSVFPNGCTLEAAEIVCCMPGEDPDGFTHLSALVEKSLVGLIEGNGGSRFQMLETIREYARQRLEESGDLDAVEERFAAYYLQFAEKAEPNLYGPEQKWWFDRIEDEYGNIRSALDWMHNRRRLEDGLRLAGAVGWFWFRRARFSEGLYWLEMFYDAVGEGTFPGPRAKAAYYLGWLKLCISSVWGNPKGKRFFRESLRLWRKAGNRRGIALSQVWLGWKEGAIEGEDGWRSADESVAIARESEDPWTIAWCLKVAYSHLRRPDKDLDSRRTALEEAITLAGKTGDPFLLSQALNGMGNVFSWIRELEAAEPWYLDSLRIAREIGDSWSILDNIFYLADGNLKLGRLRKAKELFAEGLRLSMDYGARGYLGWFIGGFYGVACCEGQAKRAVRLGAFSESILNPGSQYDPGFAQRLGIDHAVAAAEWKVGQTMTPENAVAYALLDE